MRRGNASSRRDGSFFADLALGLRLAVGGGRVSGSTLLRLGMTTVGIAIAVAVLLPAASVGNVLSERDERAAATEAITDPRPGVDPLLRALQNVEYRGKFVHTDWLAASGSNSPVPPGLDRIPEPGETIVSPAVAELMAGPDGAGMRARVPGTVVGTIGKAGVVDAGDLIVYHGSTVEQLSAVESGAQRVYGFGVETEGFALEATVLLLVVPVAAVLLLPLLIFVTTASRMGAAQRDRRLAALRLIGVEASRIRRIAAAESLLGALAGLLVGGGLFLLVLRPLIGDTELLGLRLFAEDFVPSLPLLVLIVLLVPGLAVGAAIFGLRRTIVEPLGVVRHSKPIRRRMWWRWTIIALGAALMASTLLAERLTASEAAVVALTGGSVLVLIGIAVLLPWAVEKLAGSLRGGPPSWQFAIRRLQLDSGTASRVVSGLMVVLAGTILIQVMVGSAEARPGPEDWTTMPQVAPVEVLTDTEHVQEVRQRVAAAPGVDGTHPIRSALVSGLDEPGSSTTAVEIGDCAALAVRAEVGACTDGDVFLVGPPPERAWRSGQSEFRPGPVEFTTYDEDGRHQSGETWTVPDSITRIPAAKTTGYYTRTLLVTPGALSGAEPPTDAVSVYVSGSGGTNELSDRVAAAVRPLAWDTTVHTNSVQAYDARDARVSETLRNILLGASLFVLAVAALNLLMLSVEQITERRRPLAALSAAGVPISMLARASLWQTAVPVLIGVVLAVTAGIGLTAPILRLADMPMVLDATMIGGLAAGAVGAVLLVTLLTLPLLRQVTKLDALRAE